MKSVRERWIWIAATILVSVGIILLCPPVFYLNDDVTMRSILSGAYTGTPDGHAVYMQYPLTGVLALLYRLLGFIPWFEVFFTVCILVCMALIVNQFEKFFIGVILAFTLYLPCCLYMHYTTVAALTAATAIFLIAVGRKKGCAIALLLITYMIRSQVGILCLPFVAAAMVWQVVTDSEEKRKATIFSCMKQVAIILALFVCSAVVNSCFYSSPEWRDYIEYNENRTVLYDYTDFLSTKQYSETYETFGMTGQEYQILSSYNTMLDESIDTAKMKEIANLISSNMKQNATGQNGVKDILWKYYLQIRYNDFPYNYLWMGCYLFLGVGFILNKRWLPLLMLGVLGGGRSSVWMFLIWKGRFPERVSVSLYFLEIMLLLGMSIWLIKQLASAGKRVAEVITVIGCLVFICLGFYQWQSTLQKIESRAEIQTAWTELKEYCEDTPQHIYLADVFSTVAYSDMQYTEDVPNLKLLGGWLSGSPLSTGYFNERGYSDGAEMLYYGKEVRLIVQKGKDVGWIEEYLQERFGECSLELVTEMDNSVSNVFAEYVVIPNKE